MYNKVPDMKLSKKIILLNLADKVICHLNISSTMKKKPVFMLCIVLFSVVFPSNISVVFS